MRLQGKALITGGTGFLGRATLGRAVKEHWNCEFVVYSRDEQKQDIVRRRFPHNTRMVLGDIRDTRTLALAMSGVDYVIHTGALKYIPEAEFNANECVSVNVDGSRSVITAAREAQVPVTLAISTDKAVMPLNVYGATKMLMERLFVEADMQTREERFGVVRYGNVIGSTGSIVPVWQEQARVHKMITVTDPDMTRFWMSVDDAVDLVLHGIYNLEGGNRSGEIIVQKAPAMILCDLLEALFPEGVLTDIIGRRPGEKLDEILLSSYEASKQTHYQDPYVHFAPLGEITNADGVAYESSTPERFMEADELRDAVEAASQI